ncbi:Decaprenyl diphosphate synthase-like protein [Syncephalastrum racemosum]|uniref:ditrans,polycis-polyprenyl diphosphate synthase [(2E,6E)-farnesyldiphosphate specific] n=1 Tax=Syncephalastrum racemosum TaxID=13706 RepID=A0A1X2H136_SYNRA|nr:Decaprenyl diphosphate synthase-like protein [Syncephalastrum racemosum]
MGIERFSVYDSTDELQANASEIVKRQSACLHHWIHTSHPSSTKSRPALKFSILSSKDGRSRLARLTQSIIEKGIPSSQIDLQMVDTLVHDETMSDPDLMLVYDGLPHNYLSLDGFPPWHIPLTEFIHEPQYHHLDYHLFAKTLYRYSKVEQRFGR